MSGGASSDRLPHQPLRSRRPLGPRRLGNVVEAEDDAGLVDDEPVAADDVPDAGVVDLVQGAPPSTACTNAGAKRRM